MQTKLVLLQSQVAQLTSTIKQLQEKIDSLNQEIVRISNDKECIIPSIYEDHYIDLLEPAHPDIPLIEETPFVLISNTDIDNIDSDSGSEDDDDQY